MNVRLRAPARADEGDEIQSPRERAADSIVRRVAMWATATPYAVAVADGDRRMVYEELERESSQLAARLREAGARPERCVGILLERSWEFVVAALATLKSGAAYLPIDASTPSERTEFILNDAAAVTLLTQSHLVNELPKGSWSVITTDGSMAKPATPLRGLEADPNALAYVVYTSGSTGRPKGVEITHGNLWNLIQWHHAAFAVTAGDRASQVAGLGFDAAGWEIWPYLTAGGSLHIADEATRRSPEMLREWMIAEQITIGFVPTLLAEQMFHADWPPETALRVLLTGGDRLERRPPAGLPFSVINNYGPTECTVVATSGTVSVEWQPGAAIDRPSNLGRRCAHSRRCATVRGTWRAWRTLHQRRTGWAGISEFGRAYRQPVRHVRCCIGRAPADLSDGRPSTIGRKRRNPVSRASR